MKSDTESELDLLRKIETLSEKANETMSLYSQSAIRRYPLTFTLLALFGVIAVSEGLKGILNEFGIFTGHPLYLLIAGLVILIFTGNLYKKLNK
jgi:hypothetical protein